MNIEDFEYKKSGKGYKVKIICGYCGKEDWKSWNVVEKGEGKFCSVSCANAAKFADDVEGYEWRRGKSRHIEVKIYCENCGAEKWVKLTRVREGRGNFCSVACANVVKNQFRPQHIGIDNAGKSLDSSSGRYMAYWKDEDGKQYTMSYAKWLWEQNYGEVPEGYWVTYRDGNSENCELDNLELISRGERMSEAMMGHEVSEETRKKISVAHTGKDKWTGFAQQTKYPGLSKRRKQDVKERDGYVCRICSKDVYYSQDAIVHHIDGDKTNQNWDNLVLVCRGCHALIHSRQEVHNEILAFRSMLKY